MKAKISKEFKFEAAHYLPEHDGKCRNLHGHSYRVVIELYGEVKKQGPKKGMVVDFADLKRVWTTQLEPLLDHQCLNETLSFTTTAENLAAWICQVLNVVGMPVYAVAVYETASSRAKVKFADVWADDRLV